MDNFRRKKRQAQHPRNVSRILADGVRQLVDVGEMPLIDQLLPAEFYNNAGTSKEPIVEPCGKIVMTRQAYGFRDEEYMRLKIFDLPNKRVNDGI